MKNIFNRPGHGGGEMKFYNISNHPQSKWGEEQVQAARKMAALRITSNYYTGNSGMDGNDRPYGSEVHLGKMGEIIDIPFPNVPPSAGIDEILKMAEEIAAIIPMSEFTDHNCAMVQGEFTLTVALVGMLQLKGIIVVSACTERIVTDLPDGKKSVTFNFVQFREYPICIKIKKVEVASPPQKCCMCGEQEANYAICSPCANGMEE